MASIQAIAMTAIVALAFAVPAENARVLAVQTKNGWSHWNFMSAVLRSLTEAGHHVTAFTPIPDGDRDNYTEVDTSDRYPLKLDLDMVEMMNNFSELVSTTNALTVFYRMYCDAVHGNPLLGETIRNGQMSGFDVVLVEPLGIDCMSYLADALHVPVVYVLSSPMLTFVERSFTGHVSNPACVSHLFARHAVPETFVQRFTNVALLAYSALKTQYDMWKVRLADPRPYHSSPTVQPAIVFQNSHHITESPRPIPPNVVDIGGIHLKPAKAIPKDILDFIENSPHGVIYFSFGSNIKLSSLPKHIEKTFKKVLSKVPQKILWKYEIEVNDMPKNVMVKKWFPQREILLHPNVKLFISHGGLSGVYEAVDGGVPVLGFPLYYDQPRNLEHLVRARMAITLDVLNVSEETLHNAISELINDEKYKKNAKIASKIFKDRPMTPAQSVVYWTEYVIRHEGAPHLMSYAFNLTWYQYFLLDVIGAMLVFIILLSFILYRIFKFLFNYIFMSSNNNKIKTQ